MILAVYINDLLIFVCNSSGNACNPQNQYIPLYCFSVTKNMNKWLHSCIWESKERHSTYRSLRCQQERTEHKPDQFAVQRHVTAYMTSELHRCDTVTYKDTFLFLFMPTAYLKLSKSPYVWLQTCWVVWSILSLPQIVSRNKSSTNKYHIASILTPFCILIYILVI